MPLFHSTDTAVTKVLVICWLLQTFCLLDLTAAFDTVDHDLLLHWLEREFGWGS